MLLYPLVSQNVYTRVSDDLILSWIFSEIGNRWLRVKLTSDLIYIISELEHMDFSLSKCTNTTDVCLWGPISGNIPSMLVPVTLSLLNDRTSHSCKVLLHHWLTHIFILFACFYVLKWDSQCENKLPLAVFPMIKVTETTISQF